MTVRMNADQLDRELARRGWNATDLARASGCSAATISGARRGRPISSATLCKIAEALRSAPVIPGIDELIGTELTIVGERLAAHG
ncbi:MAG TPA: helix-turn-helix transcriptional regulator [Candidatus Dormibacteraeota bacterium]|nr:helix-turn-helix transcriptional regulator [Candidatus Dormibacteraeota bacterium]